MARRGRKRRAGVKREPNGRASRSKPVTAAQAQEAKSVVINYRQRIYGLTPDQAKDAKAVLELGRLWLRKMINERQQEAGERFRVITFRHRRAIVAIADPINSAPMERVGGGVQAETISDEQIAAIRAEFDACENALRAAGRMARIVTENVCVSDLPCHETQLKPLRQGLNALVEVYGL